MIRSAEEFVALRSSDIMEEYNRAAHEEAPESVWLEVIARYPDMRKWVAHNKTISASIIAILAADPDSGVRCMIAMKRRANVSVLEKLARDPDPGVRESVAMNAKVPKRLLEELVNDPVDHVAEAARGRINKPD